MNRHPKAVRVACDSRTIRSDESDLNRHWIGDVWLLLHIISISSGYGAWEALCAAMRTWLPVQYDGDCHRRDHAVVWFYSPCKLRHCLTMAYGTLRTMREYEILHIWHVYYGLLWEKSEFADTLASFYSWIPQLSTRTCTCGRQKPFAFW